MALTLGDHVGADAFSGLQDGGGVATGHQAARLPHHDPAPGRQGGVCDGRTPNASAATLKAKLIGQGDDPWGGVRAGFEAAGKIKLKDYNITTDLGTASQDVDLIISVEGVRKK